MSDSITTRHTEVMTLQNIYKCVIDFSYLAPKLMRWAIQIGILACSFVNLIAFKEALSVASLDLGGDDTEKTGLTDTSALALYCLTVTP